MSSPLSRICRSSKPLIRLLRPRKGIFIFAIFLVLSSLFWLSTALNEYYDYEVCVPVSIEDMPENLILTSDGVDTVRVMIHDKGYALLQYGRGNSLKPISINCPAITQSSGKFTVSSSELRKLIIKRLSNSATISSIKPEKLDVSYIEGVEKSVPVRLVGQMLPASTHYLAHTEIEPSRVTVYAPADKVDSINYVMTENLQALGFTDTLTTTVALKQIPNTRIDPLEVTVSLYSDVLTEEEAEVPIIAVNVPDGTTLRTFPSRVKIRFSVGVSMFRTINTAQFIVQVDYNDIKPGVDKCPITIVEMPNGVRQASLATSEVDYLIEN